MEISCLLGLLCLLPYLTVFPGMPSRTQSVIKAMFLKWRAFNNNETAIGSLGNQTNIIIEMKGHRKIKMNGRPTPYGHFNRGLAHDDKKVYFKFTY